MDGQVSVGPVWRLSCPLDRLPQVATPFYPSVLIGIIELQEKKPNRPVRKEDGWVSIAMPGRLSEPVAEKKPRLCGNMNVLHSSLNVLKSTNSVPGTVPALDTNKRGKLPGS